MGTLELSPQGPAAKYRLKQENIIREEEEETYERGSPAKGDNPFGTLRKSNLGSDKQEFAPSYRGFKRQSKPKKLSNSMRADLKLNLKNLNRHTRSYNQVDESSSSLDDLEELIEAGSIYSRKKNI